MKRTLLVDADVVVFQYAAKNQHATQWNHDLWTMWGHLEPAIAELDAFMGELKERLMADHVVMALSDYEQPWRKQVLPTYKAHRKPEAKPILYGPLRQYVHETYETFQRPGLEGDDVLGILLTREAGADEDRICVSIDKDMNTLPGKHFNFHKPDGDHWLAQVYTVTLEQADRYHMMQTLTGDRTDGYPGIPGVGPVKAEKILGDVTTYTEGWPLIVAAYKKAGLSEEVALENARVARICRAEDYSFKEKKVKLWNPPSA